MMNRNRISNRADPAYERGACVLRYKDKTAEAQISTALRRAFLAHPDKAFLPTAVKLRRPRSRAKA
jgi:hypothetical protein